MREADESDVKAIENLANSVASERRFIVPDRSRSDWDVIIGEIKKRNSLIIVAQINDGVVGMAHLAKGKLPKIDMWGF